MNESNPEAKTAICSAISKNIETPMYKSACMNETIQCMHRMHDRASRVVLCVVLVLNPTLGGWLLPELGFKVMADAREVLGESVTVFRFEAVVHVLHEFV